MTQQDIYLAKYREVHAKEAEIVWDIGRLHAVCESLKDWRKTAANLAVSGMREIWSDATMPKLNELRDKLNAYQKLYESLETIWNAMKASDRVGLAKPTDPIG